MSEDAEQPVALRRRARTMSDHLPRIVDLSLLTIQSRDAVLEGGAARPSVASIGSIGADDVLTPADDADVPSSADGARVRCEDAEDGVTLRLGDENRAPGGDGRRRAQSCSRPRKLSALSGRQTNLPSLPVKRYSEPTDSFWCEMEAEQLVKRHSGPEGILRRRPAAVDDLPRRRSVADSLLRLAGPDPPPEAPVRPVELVLARRGMRTASSESDSSDASFHTALQSPMREASPLMPRVTITAEPARARQQALLVGSGTRQEAKPESDSKRQPKLEPERERDSQSETKEAREHESKRKREPASPSAPDPSRERADSWRLSAGRKATVSVRTRIGQFERELGVLTRRPGGAGREPAAAEPTSRWYSNQNEDDHVYFFKEGSTSSTWTLPAAENGASQTAKDVESVHLRQPPVGGVPSVLQVARGQRGRSLVFPPPPSTEPPPSQLISGNQTHVILNQGTLNHTKLAKETSWRARKSWAPCRVVLTDRSLFLFKDTRGNAGMPPQWSRAGHMPETTVDLAGAFADWDSEASSRKNVFQIRTVRGLRLLLQDDDALTAGHWFDAIKRAIADVPPSSYRLLQVARQMTDDRLTRSRSVRFTAGPDSQEDLSRDSSTIRDRLRRFFRARPPADSLVSRGILKDEPVFGGHLAALCAIEGSTVPRFVIECVSAIETKPEHMKMDGVYRASGNLSQVQRIRCEVDQDNYQVLYDEEDVHVLTGALKLFFRELKEPLIPFAVLPEALRVAGLTDRADQVTGFRRMVAGLPPPNRDTLGALLRHLDRVTELQEFNRMHAHNLAIVFGPTLMWPEQDSPDLALDLMRQNRVVEALLELKTEVLESP